MNTRVGIAVGAVAFLAGALSATTGCKRESGGATTTGSPGPGTAASGASDVKLPSSTSKGIYRDDALLIAIGQGGIRIGETRAAIIPLPPAGEAAQGVSTEYKGGTRASFDLPSLAEAIRAHWADGGQERARATLVVDQAVPYRVLIEVLFTVGRLSVSDICLAVHADARRACIAYKMSGAPSALAALGDGTSAPPLAALGASVQPSASTPPHASASAAPKASASAAAPRASASTAPSASVAAAAPLAPLLRPEIGPLTGSLIALVVTKDGYVIKSSAGAIGAGCEKGAAGVTIPKTDGRYDTAALRKCLEKVRGVIGGAGVTTFTVTAPGDATFQTIVDALDAARETDSGLPLMPAPTLAIPI